MIKLTNPQDGTVHEMDRDAFDELRRAHREAVEYDHKFNAQENKARAFWRRAQEQENGLRDGLMVIDFPSREVCHELLDKRLDQIERLRAEAREMFPEVSESFCIASMTIKL